MKIVKTDKKRHINKNKKLVLEAVEVLVSPQALC